MLGAGVAGLQAIATARRLGAVVSAFDTRPVVREQVESLGATFLDLGVRGEETEGGYARELTPERAGAAAGGARGADRRLRRRDHDRARPGPPGAAPDPAPPRCASMRPGSVIVDLAAEAGGNCELTEPGAEIVREGVTIVGPTNLAGHDAAPREPALRAQRHGAARSTSRPSGELALDFEDEITRRRLRRATRGARGPAGGCIVEPSLVIELTILVLAIFLGFEVISKVPTMLHTPLMSGTNAIHGIVIVGAILVAGRRDARHADARRRLLRGRARRRRTSSAASSSPTGCSRCSSSEGHVSQEPD